MSLKDIFFIAFFILASGAFGGSKPSHEDELRRELMKNYNKISLPNTKTTVQIRFTILRFNMNPKAQSLDLDAWISMEWEDPRLHWNAESYPDVPKLAFDAETVWHPDFALYNSANTGDVDFVTTNTHVLVMPGSKVLWVPPGHMKAACTMDLTYWPHDVHNCTAKLGSWVHSSNVVDMQIKDDFINFEDVVTTVEGKNMTHTEWSVLDSLVLREGKIYNCCPEEYVSVKASLLIQREAAAYAWMVQTPVIVLSLMTVVVFLLPPSAGEKVILGVVTLALDFFFLFAVSKIVGHSPSHTPLIVKLISKQIILTGAAVVVSSIVLRLVRDPHSTGLPTCIKMPIVVMSSCLCLNGYRQMVATSMIPITRSMRREDLELNESGGTRGFFPPDSKGGGESDWLLLAAVIDRLCLLVFSVIFLINVISYWSVL